MLTYDIVCTILKDLIIDCCLLPDRAGTQSVHDCCFEQVVNDSRKCNADTIFTAISGSQIDGCSFVPQALDKGVKLIISPRSMAESLLPGCANLVVSDPYQAYARLCEAQYDFPTDTMRGFAITGTNGKTTSAMLIENILQQANISCGMISTVRYELGGETIEADRTTPEAAELFKYFHIMRQNGLKNFVMEVSSHSLAQNRIASLRFQGAIFTNLTEDHLDYHHNMEDYFKVKKTLFIRHLAPGGKAVINSDDPYGKRLADALAPKQVVTFGCNSGKWRISNIQTNSNGGTFDLVNQEDKSERCTLSTNLVGRHNIYNVTGALLLLHATNTLPLPESSGMLKRMQIAVPGRLERFELPNGAAALVDYAHTDDALKNVLSSLRRLTGQRIITVFGAGGDRDKAKRPLMGKAAADGSDIIFLTSDNPRSENPDSIIREIRSGIPADYPQITVNPDRRAAIEHALRTAAPGDLVLIAGKGHENYQEIQGIKYPFDDRQIVKNWILKNHK